MYTNPCTIALSSMRYSVHCPSAPYENSSFVDLDDAWGLCLDLSEEFGYAEVRQGEHMLGSYTNGQQGGQLVKVSTKPARDPVSVYLREVEGSTPPTPFKPSLKSLMRKIERQMNDAITNGINWQSANTAVTFDPETETSTVYLHGNKIAEVGDFGVRLWDGDHQSATTKIGRAHV